MKGRIIFVGLHNKPDRKPLDILTKSGKLVQRIINELPKDVEIVKSNILDVDYFPTQNKFCELANEWYWTHLPDEDDIIILMGAKTHEIYNTCRAISNYLDTCNNVIKIAHPASKRSHVQMNEYVKNTVTLINR